MRLTGFLRKKQKLLSDEETHIIVKAIRHAEQQTSGEVRVYVEKHCRFMDPVDRATEVFFSLQMDKTQFRNAVLIYIALKDHQLAVFGDEGIHKKVGNNYWNKLVHDMIRDFRHDQYAEGIAGCVIKVGEALTTHFPFDKKTDKNELPDTIVFGR